VGLTGIGLWGGHAGLRRPWKTVIQEPYICCSCIVYVNLFENTAYNVAGSITGLGICPACTVFSLSSQLNKDSEAFQPAKSAEIIQVVGSSQPVCFRTAYRVTVEVTFLPCTYCSLSQTSVSGFNLAEKNPSWNIFFQIARTAFASGALLWIRLLLFTVVSALQASSHNLKTFQCSSPKCTDFYDIFWTVFWRQLAPTVLHFHSQNHDFCVSMLLRHGVYPLFKKNKTALSFIKVYKPSL